MRSNAWYSFALALAVLFLLSSSLYGLVAKPTAPGGLSSRAHIQFEPKARWVKHRGETTRKPSRMGRKQPVKAARRTAVKAATGRGRARRVETGVLTSAPATRASGGARHRATNFNPPDSSAPQPVVSILRENAVHPQLQPEDVVAASPQILSGLYDGRGRLSMPAALRGSHEILVRQNQIADQDGLTRIQDDEDLKRMRAARMLVPLPVNDGLRIDERLPPDRRFCRPWVAQFLIAMGRAHYAEFHRSVQINSAARTVQVQMRLMRSNGNAAQAAGDAASPHLTGQAIDIAKKGLSQAEIGWMRLYLQSFVEDGKIDVEEEFQQACFHLSVYKKYAPQVLAPQRIAATHRPTVPALAATLE